MISVRLNIKSDSYFGRDFKIYGDFNCSSFSTNFGCRKSENRKTLYPHTKTTHHTSRASRAT
jgi:hypothetical protein